MLFPMGVASRDLELYGFNVFPCEFDDAVFTNKLYWIGYIPV